MKYSYRKTTFTKTQTIELGEDYICTYNENNSLTGRYSYHEIESITLVYSPIKTARKLHQCTIKTSNNTKIIVRNYSYISLANFKEQTEEYLIFLKQLHNKTKSLEYIQFKKGINKIGYFSMLIFLLLMTIFMIVIAFVLYDKHKYSELTTSIFAVFVFVLMIHTFIQNFKPENYDPDNISANALPFDI